MAAAANNARSSSTAVSSSKASAASRFIPRRPISIDMIVHNDHSKGGNSDDSDSEGQSVARGGVVTPFPWKVHDMLEKAEIDGIDGTPTSRIRGSNHGKQPTAVLFNSDLTFPDVKSMLLTLPLLLPFSPYVYLLYVYSYSPIGSHKQNLPPFNVNSICMAFAVSRRVAIRALTSTLTF
jgi:hypothetical protein